MFSKLSSRSLVLATVASLSALAACGPVSDTPRNARVTGTEIDNTMVKWQSIGNCWVYAAMGWVESLHMTATGEKLNLSESYISYMHIKEQLVDNSYATEVETGGSWWDVQDLISKYGVMNEGDFIPSEADKAKSDAQAKAIDYLNTSLKSGALKNNRSEATVIRELNKAFGVNLAEVSSLVIPANKLVVGKNGTRPVTLATEVQAWNSEYVSGNSTQLMRRVIRALNDRKPVIMTWHVDFNALDNKGVFSMETLRAAGGPGRQGGHMTVIEDYLASGVDESQPAKPKFVVGEGLVAPELQELAAKYGNIDALIVKNSWGGSDRTDRGSYIHDNEGGFHFLKADYLFGRIPLAEGTGSQQGLKSVILPAGY